MQISRCSVRLRSGAELLNGFKELSTGTIMYVATQGVMEFPRAYEARTLIQGTSSLYHVQEVMPSL